MNIPVNEPVLSKEAKRNVRQALSSGWLSSAGPFVAQFEQAFADYLGVQHAISVSNGTAALHVALLSLGIGPGDEVIVPAFTMAATWLAVLYVGATPVFIDCELETYNIDVSLIEKAITAKTKAILPVHIYGHPADLDPILEIAKRHGLFVVEDAAEAHGAQYRGKKCGTFGDISCFSFYANKIITTGEGGMVVCNNDSLAKEARKLRDLYHSDAKRFVHEKIGFNYRITNLQAAIGLGELSHIDQYIQKKLKMVKLYHKYLKDIAGLFLPVTASYAKNVYWMYAIRVDESKFGISRDELRYKLKNLGIDTRDFFYPPTMQPILAPYLTTKDFPKCDLISSQGLYLPSGLRLTTSQIITTARAIHSIHLASRV